MMRTTLLRQAAATRAALAARPAQAAYRASSAALGLSRPARTAPAAVRRSAASLLRFYSSESAAPAPSADASSGFITRFADLPQLGVNNQLVHSITKGMGYENMTDVQSMTINAALAGKDVVAQAKTGTGKTLAFLVPIVQRIIAGQPELEKPRGGGRARSDDIRAIILSPTRELAEQIGVEAKKLCQGTGVIVQTAVGGTHKNLMLRKTRIEGCHLLVATPGRLHDLLTDESSGIDAPRLAALVLDEADRMLDVGFKTELENIVRYLPDREKVPRQTLLYSATLPKNVVGIARQFINPTNFEFVQTVRADEVPTHERVPQFIVPCRGFENLAPTLLELIRRDVAAAQSDPEKLPFKAIVFLPTTSAVMSYSYLFRRLKHDDRSIPRVYDIHSKLTQKSRTRSADDFRDAQSAILFSSDVSARGMDFPNVTHVIQVHLPQDRDLYIHRIGRTGRAGKQGVAYLLASDVEVPGARDLLPGLPIQRCTDFECASVDVTKADTLPEPFRQLREAAEKAPFDILRDTYTSLLGNAIRHVDRQDVVHEANNLAKYGWGMDEPPAVSPRLAQNVGRGIRGLRISDTGISRHDGRGSGFGGRDGGFGGRGIRDGRSGRSGDPFSAMERMGNDRPRRHRAPPPAF
ncbi:DEAD-domain-containing protein [Parathielavia appendiculata]|uniref:ATP-dependent RNA helicase n=1 Tax=Parathielavia appendiculata TaxID=2587402 RepID=A0AAN6U712_9PEZI|nr:DEAD-domain-containing protein [Parathielavia appendiculata]